MEFFLVWIQENTAQKKLHIWTHLFAVKPFESNFREPLTLRGKNWFEFDGIVAFFCYAPPQKNLIERSLKFLENMFHYFGARFHFFRISGCRSISFFWMDWGGKIEEFVNSFIKTFSIWKESWVLILVSIDF